MSKHQNLLSEVASFLSQENYGRGSTADLYHPSIYSRTLKIKVCLVASISVDPNAVKAVKLHTGVPQGRGIAPNVGMSEHFMTLKRPYS